MTYDLKTDNARLLALLSETQSDLDNARGRIASLELQLKASEESRREFAAWIAESRKVLLEMAQMDPGIPTKLLSSAE